MKAQEMTGKGLHDEIAKVFKNSNIKQNAKILDAGCGQGALLEKIYELNYKNLHGCDINDKNLKFKKINFEKVDLNKNIPYKDKTFDVIFSIENLEHLQGSWNLINEFHRVLKPGGLLISSTPNLHTWYNRLYYFFTGGFDGFAPRDPKNQEHIFPLFKWTLEKMIYKKFKIEKFAFGRSVIPLLRINIPLKGFMFSECYIAKMKKI